MKHTTRLRLAQRRTVWCPTWLGSFCAILLIIIPAAWWSAYGESYLSLTQGLPAEILVVEGWIGLEGIRAAATEFQERGYQYVVTTGGMTDGRWDDRRGNYAEMAERVLVRSGVPGDRIIVARADDTKNRRTYESAVAVWRALHARGMLPRTLNVFTMGPHARRSRMVFAKVEGPGTKVGVVAWIPSDYRSLPWWRSSDRAKELLTETAGYIYEALLNSGRRSNVSSKDSSAGTVRCLVSGAK